MADLADIQDTFDNHLFVVACQDVARIVSILSLDAQDITKPRSKNSYGTNIREKAIFFYRFFFMVFVKGFTPTIFDLLPYRVWQIITLCIYLYRLYLLPFWLRFTGYGRYASWTTPMIGSAQPKKGDIVTQPYKLTGSISVEGPLSKTDFGDIHFENLITVLYNRQAHLSPHTKSPGTPFVSGFPGNFFSHLTGVYKILVAWGQPQYVVRAGLYHSVYGTFDYRQGIFDLRDGRKQLADIIGPAAEELSFAICTSDRLGLMPDLMKAMYGEKGGKAFMGGGIVKAGDGNPYPPLIGELSANGFMVRNHITQEPHVFSPDLFAQFIMVFMADFIDQGALPLGSDDSDICLFQFLRYRFFSDMVRFVKPYLRVVPAVWFKYLGDKDFVEPLRKEVLRMKGLWKKNVSKALAVASPNSTTEGSVGVTRDGSLAARLTSITGFTEDDKQFLVQLIARCNYLSEPKIALACALTNGEVYQVRRLFPFHQK